jgi:hypothetical protein
LLGRWQSTRSSPHYRLKETVLSHLLKTTDAAIPKIRKKVTEGALANHVANSCSDRIDHGLDSRPLLAFAVCYITAHYVLDLITEEQASAALDYCDENMD